MILNKKAESLIQIIIVISIIGIIMLSVSNLIEYDSKINFEYNKINDILILERNTDNLLKKLDRSSLVENDRFYIYQSGSEIKIFTGIRNENYKYINYLGELVEVGNYKGIIYTRECLFKSNNIKCDIKEFIKRN